VYNCGFEQSAPRDPLHFRQRQYRLVIDGFLLGSTKIFGGSSQPFRHPPIRSVQYQADHTARVPFVRLQWTTRIPEPSGVAFRRLQNRCGSSAAQQCAVASWSFVLVMPSSSKGLTNLKSGPTAASSKNSAFAGCHFLPLLSLSWNRSLNVRSWLLESMAPISPKLVTICTGASIWSYRCFRGALTGIVLGESTQLPLTWQTIKLHRYWLARRIHRS